jgi:hypothetical protein
MLNTQNVMSGAWRRVCKEVTRNRNDACGNGVIIHDMERNIASYESAAIVKRPLSLYQLNSDTTQCRMTLDRFA